MNCSRNLGASAVLHQAEARWNKAFNLITVKLKGCLSEGWPNLSAEFMLNLHKNVDTLFNAQAIFNDLPNVMLQSGLLFLRRSLYGPKIPSL